MRSGLIAAWLLLQAWAGTVLYADEAPFVRASLAEAEAMVERAAALVASIGVEPAMERFNTPGNGFHDRDLYIYAVDAEGFIRAHGLAPALIGRHADNYRTFDGRSIIREVISLGDRGTVTYDWPNPATGRLEQKIAFVRRVDDLFVVCGGYVPLDDG